MKNVVVILLLLSGVFNDLFAQKYFLQETSPAQDWMTEAYPIGNGKLGAMIFSGVDTEQIQFNESSLWTGDEIETGEYQAFGDVFLKFDYQTNQQQTAYQRKLVLDSAVHITNFRKGNNFYKRKYFASYPDKVLVFNYKSSNKKGLNLTIALKDAHEKNVYQVNQDLVFDGQLNNGMKYAAQLRVILKDGVKSIISDEQGNAVLKITDASEFTMLLSAATDFQNTRNTGWKSVSTPIEINNKSINQASRQSFSKLLKKHYKDYHALYSKLAIELGNAELPDDIATSSLLKNYKNSSNLALESLLYQYGRYLLISSSREGGLPANLQGLWNNSNTPPWRSDYHSNINVQMNYWPVEVANLSASFRPYFDFINSIREVKKENTQKEYPGVRGWTVRTENNIFGGESYKWNTPGSAWFAQALWEHYAFNQDIEYLRNQAYPILKEICEFWDDRLIRRENGVVVAPMGWSPEHGPIEDAISHDHQIIYDLFTNYIEAENILNIDSTYKNHIIDLKNRLLGPKIGRWGQLQEWETDRDDSLNTHRHVSHLFALYPGKQISVLETPELTQAAKVSLIARGDESTGWSMAWKMAFWARLQDGEHAYKILKNFISYVDGNSIDYDNGGGLYANLLCAHPPFQIDGNLGYVASLSEMLVQSQTSTLEFLPALSPAWREGSVRGLKARGNILIDELVWENNEIKSLKLSSAKKQSVEILTPKPIKGKQATKQINGKFLYTIDLKPNRVVRIY